MSRPLRLSLLLSLGGLSISLMACAPTARLAPPPGASSGAPAPVAGYDWHLNEDPGEVSLSYGLAHSDDVPLDLSCAPGSGALQILQPVPHGHPAAISLESGGDTETYPATGEASELHEGLYLTASARTSDPVFKRFEDLGWLAAYGADYRTPFVAQPGSETRIARFFKLCR